jgi:exopolyphosphatase/guanosine-5'-triphosphate,3'-diphosphate pyrophosphatase
MRRGDPPYRLAVIDLGSNTAQMTVLLADPRDTRRLRVVEDLQVITGLGRGRAPDGALSEAGRRGAMHALLHFSRRLDALGVAPSAVRAATTSAVREAPNGPRFLREVTRSTGLEFRIITGTEEAELTALAQARSFPDRVPFVVADIGGDSTEVALRERAGTAWATSTPVGSLRLAAAHGDDVEALEAAVAHRLDELPSLGRAAGLIVAAGTATTALQVVRRLDLWDPEQIHGRPLARDELRESRDLLAAMAPGARRTGVPGLLPGRADAIVAGMTLLLGLMTWAGVERITVSDRGVRYGLLWESWPAAIVTS